MSRRKLPSPHSKKSGIKLLFAIRYADVNPLNITALIVLSLQCASKVLGGGKPEVVYNGYDRGQWEEKVEWELGNSGLPYVIHKLTHELVDRTRQNALTSEMAEAFRLVRELRKKEGYICYASLVFIELMSMYLRRKLLEARRTEVEFEEAKSTYNKTIQKLQMILNTWDLRGQEQVDKSRRQLQNTCAFISRKADGFIQPALEKVLQHWGLVDRDSDSDSTNSMLRIPRGAEYTNQVSIFLLCSGSDVLNDLAGRS